MSQKQEKREDLKHAVQCGKPSVFKTKKHTLSHKAVSDCMYVYKVHGLLKQGSCVQVAILFILLGVPDSISQIPSTTLD